MSLKQQMLQRLEEVQGAPKKSLGQNFLINEHVVTKIIDSAKAAGISTVFEVGPGLGALTEGLLPMATEFSVIEMDRNFAAYWRNRGVKVLEADALKADWESLVIKPALLVSNLPYQISSRLVIELSHRVPELKFMVLMFQREVADRIMAKPRTADYGFLSVIAQLGWKIEKVADASPQDFFPPPKVSSRVLRFTRNSLLTAEFVARVHLAFENRRKFMLKNFSQERDRLLQQLQQLGYTEKVRAEELSPSEFLQLFGAGIEH